MHTNKKKQAQFALYDFVNSESPQSRLDDLRDDISQLYRNGMPITFATDYVELPTTNGARPQFDRMLADLRSGIAGGVAVRRLEVFGRSVQQIVRTLYELHGAESRIVSLRERLDIATPLGSAIVGILAELMEFEKANSRARIAAGVERARTDGKKLGRPRSDVDLVLLTGLRQRGHSYESIARRLKTSKATVIRALRRIHDSVPLPESRTVLPTAPKSPVSGSKA